MSNVIQLIIILISIMNEIKNIIDDLAIDALEANTKIAAASVITNLGTIVYQTENFNLTNQTDTILNIYKGHNSFVLNNFKFTVTRNTPEGIIATNNGGMGHIIVAPFQGGLLVVYAMPQADPSKALSFLKTFTTRLNGKV